MSARSPMPFFIQREERKWKGKTSESFIIMERYRDDDSPFDKVRRVGVIDVPDAAEAIQRVFDTHYAVKPPAAGTSPQPRQGGEEPSANVTVQPRTPAGQPQPITSPGAAPIVSTEAEGYHGGPGSRGVVGVGAVKFPPPKGKPKVRKLS